MRRAFSFLFIFTAIGAAMIASVRAASQTSGSQTPEFSAEVELVTVDVVVADKQGSPITGLRREEFTLTEDGKAQGIASFEPIVVPTGPAPASAVSKRVASNTDQLKRNARTFVIVFDGLHLSPMAAIQAKQAIEKFLSTGLNDDDYVMLLSTQSATWMSTRFGLGKEQLLATVRRQKGTARLETGWDFMSDYEALRVDAYRDVDVGARVARRWAASGFMLNRSQEEAMSMGRVAANQSGTAADPSIIPQPGTIDSQVTDRAREIRQDARIRQDATLAMLKRVIGALTDVRGRKAVMLVSGGFVVDLDTKERAGVIDVARQANAAIYFVDARGLAGLPTTFSAEWGSSHTGVTANDQMAYATESDLLSEGCQAVAADSGGFTLRSGNDLAAGMGRIARESQAYYLLGYHPTRTTRDGKFHRIGVEVSRKDVVVRARRGYYAPGADGSVAQQPEAPAGGSFQSAVDSPYDLDGIPLRIAAHTFGETTDGKVKTIVVADVEVGQFRWNEKEARFLDAVEFLLLVADRATDEVQRYDQTIELNLRPETRAQLQASSLPIRRDFELPPGHYLVKLVVREKNSARTGTVSYDLTVPEPKGLRLSTPVLTDTLREVPGQALPRPVMKAQRTFASGSRLVCQYDVYGAELGQTDQKPHVRGGYALLRADGALVAEAAATPINAPTGAVNRILGLSLAGLEPGEYRLALRIEDEVAGRKIEVVEPFAVSAAAAPAASTAGPASGTASTQ
jgi:VWFA-related protein